MLGVLTGCGGDDSSGGVKTVPVAGVDSGDKNDDNADVDSTVDDDTDTDTDTDDDSTKDDDTTDDDTVVDDEAELFPHKGKCTVEDFTVDRVNIESRVANSDYECMRTWFSPSLELADVVFSTMNVSRITGGLKKAIEAYKGTKEQAQQIYYLGEFIKAAYKNRHDTFAKKLQPFPSELSVDIANTIQQFLRSPYALTEGREQQEALASMLIVVDSIRQLAIAAPDVFAILDSFSADKSDSYYYRKAINNIFVAMAGHSQTKAFYDVIESDSSYIHRLSSFITNNEWAIGTDSEQLLGNAARELARLVKTEDAETKKVVVDTLDSLLKRYPLGGKSDRIWVGIAEMVDAYASDYLEQLGLSNSKSVLKQRIMTFSYDCRGPARILAQEITEAQAITSCETLNLKEDDFHQTVNTGYQPVADDHSDSVDVIVFKTKSDYSTYSSFLFDNTTNNGGQFLERDPSKQGNVPRFVAYQNGWDDDFSILNLEHEYVHYLDGRFNQYGDFHDTMREGSIVWWLEGFAEYMHYKEGYNAALVLGKEKTHTLADVFSTNYRDGLNRVYRWGYLAVRFMIEKHPEDVTELLGYSRTGQYKEWVKLLERLGPAYNTEFHSWLDEVTKDIDDSDISQPKPKEKPKKIELNTSIQVNGKKFSETLFFVDVSESYNQLEVSISGTGDADLYACYDKVCHYFEYEWSNYTHGSNETISIPKNEDGSIKMGQYYFSISGREEFDVELSVVAK
ncbi:M9 family metallopeptidase [Vibrio parahaemolyticus]|uniref:M9 family metallopeptidase n=1 Tax=Vibrio parahaemolyticus TaxID=670 RepID=UPI001D20DAEE|nr:M9 family metallopeptidase [Vibrio parahaemolyticus]EGR3135870.1 collagenase [Vibrio parahaemolyticus]EHY8868454.1 collagenase [Vibrio parahaemolyticus]EII3131700.1 collagenase [Vibrio parahaemolyticus]EJG1507518.1 collagenase [Vibrio parahaemolyticus]MCS0068719.1 M9 family metallopeptidase [Vibrio parahaemolyticus]